MKVIADLHIHGRYSRATSKSLDIANLEKYSRLKGLNLLGTGDFTHPLWLNELRATLSEDGSGILKTKSGFAFVLQTEVSLIYTQGGKGRRIHNIVLAPDLATVSQISEALGRRGRLDYDGRPIFNIACPEFVEMMKGIDDRVEIIPAHAWTPWFSLFGSMSGFDSLKECFQEQTRHIHAIETGLSSDPAMNWRLSQLDNVAITSFSDCHSFWPWRIGREATIFELKRLSYQDLIKAIRTKEGLVETIEVAPEFGKYHFTGHRNCNISLEPSAAIKISNFCPVCSRRLTIGVAQRVEELADRPEGYIPKDARKFRKLIPLSELLSILLKKGINSTQVWAEYNKLIKQFGSEFDVLLFADEESLKETTNDKIIKIILRNREGGIKVKPGFDGLYGIPLVDSESVLACDERHAPKTVQTNLTKF